MVGSNDKNKLSLTIRYTVATLLLLAVGRLERQDRG